MLWACELRDAVLSAMPVEMRVRIESPGDPILLATLAAKEGVEATSAVYLDAPLNEALEEIDQAIIAFTKMRSAIEHAKQTGVNRGVNGGSSIHATLYR